MRLRFSNGVLALLACVAQPEAAASQTVDPWADIRTSAAPTEAEAADEAADSREGESRLTTGAVRRVEAEQPVKPEPPVERTDPESDVADVPLRRTLPAAIDPYEPLGIRAGTFILYPSLEITLGYTTNARESAGGSESGFASVTPELRIVSDWARHEATLTMRGTYEDFFDDSADDQPSALVEGTARLDFAEGWTGNLAAGYEYERQSFSDPNFPEGVDKPPGVHAYTSSAELRGGLGRNVVALGVELDRTVYEDGKSGGVIVDQSDRDNTEIGGRLRYGFEVTPILMPFVEGEIARRIYDRKFDDDGIERSGWLQGLRGGIVYKSGPVLTAEIAVGYARAELDDPSLSAIDALTFDGSIVWAPTELTTVTLNASTEIDASTDPLSSGSVLHEGAIDLAYRWRENVTLNGLAEVSHERLEGLDREDTTYQLGVGATWRINRTLQLSGGYTHEWLESSDPANDYTSDSILFTLRMQR